jgi:hypothetical protein
MSMAYQKDTIHNNNLFIRCWECGDSERRSYVAHMNISLSNGLYHCFRCGTSGKLTTKQWVDLIPDIDIAMPETLPNTDYLDTLPTLRDERFTLLTSQYNGSVGYRQWVMRDAKGDTVGYHHRYANKKSENIGKRGLGYSSKQLNTNKIIRVVEGVYDVVLPDSVCVFGKITSGSIRLLKHYDLCLCPDSDVLHNKKSLYHFYKTVVHNTNVLFVELIRNGDAHDLFMSGQSRGEIVKRDLFLQRAKRVIK